MKSLRETRTRDLKDPESIKKVAIPFMATGEYGEETKRPHWHILLFNYRPHDSSLKRETKLGHKVWTSETLTKIWGKGDIEFGSITLDSASYTARYSAKKLVHGQDDEHDFHPIHRTSKRYALGKTWIEKYWEQTFNHGYVTLPNMAKAKIPRYYTDWLKKNQPQAWEKYVTGLRLQQQEIATIQNRKEELQYIAELLAQQPGHPRPVTRTKVKLTILNQKFKQLQESLKL